MKTIFMPSIGYFKEKRDGRWIKLVWYIKREQSFLVDLTDEPADFVLSSLVYLPVIDTHAEFVVAILARKHSIEGGEPQALGKKIEDLLRVGGG
jgi:hypothetical protein